MIKTIEIAPDIIAPALAKEIANNYGQTWLIWRFNGDFNYIDWASSERELAKIIKEYLNR